VSDMREHHTADGVKFVLTAPATFWDSVEASDGGLVNYFKLVSSINIGERDRHLCFGSIVVIYMYVCFLFL
jgi:hypothetical protein